MVLVILVIVVFVAKIVYKVYTMVSHNPAIICQLCGVQGKVAVFTEERKAGISGGKATGAILTGGTSVLFTGLSRMETVTVARCDHCHTSWTIQ